MHRRDKPSAFHATQISELLSQINFLETTQNATTRSTGQCCAEDQQCVTGGHCSSRLQMRQELDTLLCYSCRRTIKDMETVETLPPYIKIEAERRQNRSYMKREIAEFLLEEEEE